MTWSPPFHIPGSYFPDAPPPLNTHVGASVFRPPESPSPASSAFLTRLGTSESLTPAPNSKRKRVDEEQENITPDWRTGMSSGVMRSKWYEGSDFGPTPGREARYALAGQLDTPGAGRAATPGGLDGILDESVYSDVGYRRELGPKQDSTGQFAVGQTSDSLGWGQVALGAIGDVVGKVWEFCKAGAFRGFYAGGGRGYDFHSGHSSPINPFSSSLDRPRLPGGFPSGDSIPSYPDQMEVPVADPTPSRPSAKRRQVKEANDDLRRNWVMVENPNGEKRLPPSRRTSSRASAAAAAAAATGRRIHVPVSRLNSSSGPSLVRRTSHRLSHAGSPALMNREPASYASPRSSRPLSPPSAQRAQSPSRIPVASPRTSTIRARKSQIPSPIQPSFNASSHRRTQSGASAASTRSRPKDKLDVDDIEASPRLNAEAKELATRMLVEEEDTDVRISAFNARLRDMIRQGKEALSTKVEVTMEDGGWLDEE